MNRTFTINGTVYTARKMDFNTIADLADFGLDMMSGKLPLPSTARAYFAVCAGIDKESAGDEIQKHLNDGGDLADLFLAFKAECEESGFMKPAKKPEIKAVSKEESETT